MKNWESNSYSVQGLQAKRTRIFFQEVWGTRGALWEGGVAPNVAHYIQAHAAVLPTKSIMKCRQNKRQSGGKTGVSTQGQCVAETVQTAHRIQRIDFPASFMAVCYWGGSIKPLGY